MSAIQQKLQALKEQEEKLRLEQKKVDFLQHILASAKDFNDKDFAEVKEPVVTMLADFVKNATHCIETGQIMLYDTVEARRGKTDAPASEPTKTEVKQPAPQAQPTKVAEMSPGEKMNFALDNRHLSGQKVNVLNDKNIDIQGEVVGLDAPYVFVKTTTGPTIKVPLDKVSLQ